jgi:hypothetical protein
VCGALYGKFQTCKEFESPKKIQLQKKNQNFTESQKSQSFYPLIDVLAQINEIETK